MVYLGIDYGRRKIGLSISEGNLAVPLSVIKIKGLSDALDKISKAIKDNQVEKVVVGMPESGEARYITKKFITELKKYIEVIEAEETLSTYNANQYLKKQSRKKKEEDALAAAIILQNYLDGLN